MAGDLNFVSGRTADELRELHRRSRDRAARPLTSEVSGNWHASFVRIEDAPTVDGGVNYYPGTAVAFDASTADWIDVGDAEAVWVVSSAEIDETDPGLTLGTGAVVHCLLFADGFDDKPVYVAGLPPIANWTEKTGFVEGAWRGGLLSTTAQSLKGPKTFRDVAAVRARVPATNGGMFFTWSGPLASSIVCSANGDPAALEETNPDQLSAPEVATTFAEEVPTARVYARQFTYGFGDPINEAAIALVGDATDPDVSGHIMMVTNGAASGIRSGGQGISFFGGGAVDFVTTSPLIMPNICIGSNAYIWHDGNLFAAGPCYQILNENPPYDGYPLVGHHIGKYEDVDIPIPGGTTLTLHFRGGIYVDKSSRTTGDPSVPYVPPPPPDPPPEVPPLVPPPPGRTLFVRLWGLTGGWDEQEIDFDSGAETQTTNGDGQATFADVLTAGAHTVEWHDPPDGDITWVVQTAGASGSGAIASFETNGQNDYLCEFTIVPPPPPPATYTISGTVTVDGSPAARDLTLAGTEGGSTTSDGGTGAYSFPGLAEGTYSVTVDLLPGETCTPSGGSHTGITLGPDATGKNFVIVT